MKVTRMVSLVLVALLYATGAAAEKDWKAEAKKWKMIAKAYEAKYGWIEDRYGWCSMNRGITNFGGYDEPSCIRPTEPWCASSYSRGCDQWEIDNYKMELQLWVTCRRQYIREAREDAGCALRKIKDGIEKAIAGE